MRQRKVPPVSVPDGAKYCFKCQSLLPAADFAKDAKSWDGKKLDCRRCNSAAAGLRDQRTRLIRKVERDLAALTTELRRATTRSSRITTINDQHHPPVHPCRRERQVQGVYL